MNSGLLWPYLQFAHSNEASRHFWSLFAGAGLQAIGEAPTAVSQILGRPCAERVHSKLHYRRWNPIALGDPFGAHLSGLLNQ